MSDTQTVTDAEELRGPRLRRLNPRSWAITLVVIAMGFGVLFSQFLITFFNSAH